MLDINIIRIQYEAELQDLVTETPKPRRKDGSV